MTIYKLGIIHLYIQISFFQNEKMCLGQVSIIIPWSR